PDFEVAGSGFGLMPPAPWTLLNGLESGSPRQRTGYASQAMDAALADLRAASTLEETRAAMAQLQTVWNEEFPVIIRQHSMYGIAVADHVHGMEYGSDATPYFDRAWVE